MKAITTPALAVAMLCASTLMASGYTEHLPGPASHVEVNVYNELSGAGNWEYHAYYNWVWQPLAATASHGWHPYSHHGQWGINHGQRCWVSHYSWGAHVYNQGGQWVLVNGFWSWVPPRHWMHAAYLPPAPCRRARPVHPVYHRPHYQPRHYHSAPAPARHAPRHTPRHAQPHATVARPAATHRKPAPPPRQRSQTNARSGGRLDALLKKHRSQ